MARKSASPHAQQLSEPMELEMTGGLPDGSEGDPFEMPNDRRPDGYGEYLEIVEEHEQRDPNPPAWTPAPNDVFAVPVPPPVPPKRVALHVPNVAEIDAEIDLCILEGKRIAGRIKGMRALRRRMVKLAVQHPLLLDPNGEPRTTEVLIP